MKSNKLLSRTDILCRMCNLREGYVMVEEGRYIFHCPRCGYIAHINRNFNQIKKSNVNNQQVLF